MTSKDMKILQQERDEKTLRDFNNLKNAMDSPLASIVLDGLQLQRELLRVILWEDIDIPERQLLERLDQADKWNRMDLGELALEITDRLLDKLDELGCLKSPDSLNQPEK